MHCIEQARVISRRDDGAGLGALSLAQLLPAFLCYAVLTAAAWLVIALEFLISRQSRKQTTAVDFVAAKASLTASS